MIIYKAENKLNGQVYIGKTVSNLNKRRQDHIYSAGRSKNTYFHNAIRVYGIDNFEWSVLAETDLESKLNSLERFYIMVYRKMGSVYNLTDGGEGTTGRIYSEETIRKMSEAQKGKKGKPLTEEQKQKRAEVARNMSEEQRQSIRESNSRRIHTEESRRKRSEKRKEYTHSDQTKEKISKANTGKIVSEETRRKQGIANSKRIWTEESRKKISEANKGRTAWNKGLKKSEQTQTRI